MEPPLQLLIGSLASNYLWYQGTKHVDPHFMVGGPLEGSSLQGFLASTHI